MRASLRSRHEGGFEAAVPSVRGAVNMLLAARYVRRMSEKGRRMEYIDDLARIASAVRVACAAVVDDAGLPATCPVEMAGADGDGVYVLVDRDDECYKLLASRKSMALTGIEGALDAEGASLSLRGRIEEAAIEAVLAFADAPDAGAVLRALGCRDIAAFRLYQASGELVERRDGQARRMPVRFGEERMNAGVKARSYIVTDECDGCRACVSKCAEGCIDVSMVPAVIDQDRCTRCGNCATACFQEAIIVVK